ncbi:MAG: hypothetical protein QNJ65_00415 [Xenococcaceae cyanobacterium MO_234.B1]|nr:hypothetical protein [Xenococcaceae cyanobacterium MO_234.B1]
MTPELTPEQRLTQIEKILASAIKLSHSNTAKIEANTEMIDRIGQKVEANTEMIDRIGQKVEANTEMIDRIGQKVEVNTEAIAAQDLKIDRLTEQMGRATDMFIDSMNVMRTMQTNIENMQTDIREMQSEIRGLQVENRRIIDRVFGEDN